MENKAMDATALTISIIGAINWGLIGFFNFNLVSFLFGSMTWLSRIIYAIVGICGIYLNSCNPGKWDLCQRRAGLILGLFNKQIRESMLYLKINDELGIYKEG